MASCGREMPALYWKPEDEDKQGQSTHRPTQAKLLSLSWGTPNPYGVF